MEQHETVGKPDQDIQEAIRSGEIDQERSDEGMDVSEDEDGRHSMEVETAFVVFVQDGAGFGVANLGDVAIRLEDNEIFLESMRKATPDDMYRFCMEVAKDIQVAATAEQTMARFVAYTQRMQQQMQAQMIAQQAGVGGQGGGLHVPGR